MILAISIKSLKSKRIYIKILFSYIIGSLFIVLLSTTFLFIKKLETKLLKKQSTYNKATYTAVDYSGPLNFDDEYVLETYVYTSCSSGSKIDNVVVDGKEYKTNYFIFGFMTYGKTFPMNTDVKYEIIGELPKENNEIMISDKIWKSLGNIDIIGKKVDFVYNSQYESITGIHYYLKNVKVSGIFIDGTKEDYGVIYLNNEISIDCLPIKNTCDNTSVTVYFKDYSNTMKYIDTLNGKYNLDLRVYNSEIIELYTNVKNYGSAIISIFLIFTVVLIIAMVVYSGTLSYIEIRTNHKEYEILEIYGLKKNNVRRVIFLSHFLIYLLASIISTLITLIVYIIFSNTNILNNLVVNLPIYLLIISVGLNLIFGAIVMYIISKIIFYKYKENI